MGDKAERKAPLGVEPQCSWKEGRIEALRQAINRYLDAGWWPHVEWIREMADLIEERMGPTRGPSSSPDGADPIDSEIDGLPSVATAAPSAAHDPPDPTAGEPSFADAALSAVQEFFGPWSPTEGLQEPSTPQSPMDAEYDEWVDMVSRVNASAFRPWQDSRAGWCARSPVTKRVEIFGRSFNDYAAAYRWVHQLLDQSSKVATQPPSAPKKETSS